MSKDKSEIEPRPTMGATEALETLLLPAEAEVASTPIWLVGGSEEEWRGPSQANRAWLAASDWKAQAGAVALLPGADGALAGAVLGLGKGEEPANPLITGALPRALPPGNYHLATALDDPDLAALGWLLGAYAFCAYKPCNRSKPARLKLPRGADDEEVLRIARAVIAGRDLINTPANDLGPAELAAAALALADAHGAASKVTVGEELIAGNFPLIHAVGRASDRAPRLIDFSWGNRAAPKVTLIGKGICFDTGGLNLKPAQGMALMKKDMGGAAAALASASMIMEARLPVRLRVLIPAADNSVSAQSFRPGDVLASRGGLTVEIGNTDAEGRLVLADAIALADEEAPDLLVTFATLTGAARVALGPDLPALYATDDVLAEDLQARGLAVGDPLWRMPFWSPYEQLLRSKIADINHISEGGHAGSITAALFLKRFVARARAYAHFDIFAWVPRAQPARPEGGEVQGARALYDVLRARYRA